jgi:energy-coupling factor transporter ATP-binding protein EcfA2
VKQLRTQCAQWLCAPNMSNCFQTQLKLRTQDTCVWIQHHPMFLAWKNSHANTSKKRLLAVIGTHGCGKSVLAAVVTATLREDGASAFYFSFSSSDPQRQTSDSMIRSLLLQCLNADKSGLVVSALQTLMADGDPQSTAGKLNTLKQVLAVHERPHFAIIDGLDESSELMELATIFWDLLGANAQLKFLVLGRTQVFDQMSNSDPSPFQYLRMNSSLTQPDIDAYLVERLDKITLVKTGSLRDEAFRTLQQNSSSMFLWVHLMANDLQKAGSKHDLRRRLQNVPQSLQETYDLTFGRCTIASTAMRSVGCSQSSRSS